MGLAITDAAPRVGEFFDSRALTAAHRALPFGARIRVTNERSGKSVIVRINDRGPFGGRRVLDLSSRAAQAIGITGMPVFPWFACSSG